MHLYLKNLYNPWPQWWYLALRFKTNSNKNDIWIAIKCKMCGLFFIFVSLAGNPDSKVHGANMGPTWALSAIGGLHVGPINLVIRVSIPVYSKRSNESRLLFDNVGPYARFGHLNIYTSRHSKPFTVHVDLLRYNGPFGSDGRQFVRRFKL